MILSLDTSAIASAALVNDDGVLVSFASGDTRTHAEVLTPAVRDLLLAAGIDGTDLDAVVTGTGPGPFTGLRAGIATARTLAFVWNVPLFGLMSLEAIAADALTDARERGLDEYVVATDARRKEVYWARYSAMGNIPKLLEGPAVASPPELPALPVYGKGAGLYADALSAVQEFTDLQPSASSLGVVTLERIRNGTQSTDTTPLYLRESDAQVPGPRKRALS
nr:tRNA (adenosine(37)-N6)-threonylcarbamoyltransferase complex dimerization subunit type 1 TsaB [Arthrobacter roseus]